MQLRKSLSPLNIWAIALGTIIGFGCFVLPGLWLLRSGPMGIVIGMTLGGITMIIIGRSYGFMVRNFPVAGGPFVYSYQSLGRNHAFVCGWFLAIGYLSIVSLNAIALPIIVKFVAPDIFTSGYMYSVAGWDIYVGEVILSSLAIILFGYFNYRGTKLVGSVQVVMVILVVGSVILLAIGSFYSPNVTISNLKPPFAPDKTPLTASLAIWAIAPWAFVGFSTIPQAAEEFNFSPRKAFKLTVMAISFGSIMYVIVSLATAVVMPWQELTESKPIWATGSAIEASLGTFGVIFLLVAVTMAIATCINGLYLATSRLLLSMARAKVLPAWFAKIHPSYRTPSNAIIFILILSLFAPWFGREALVWIVDMSAVGIAIGFVYTCLSAFLLSKDKREEKGSLTYMLGAILSVGFLILLCVPGMPSFMALPSWIALAAWVLLGITFYAIRRKGYRSIPKVQLDSLILGESMPDTTKADEQS